jgi:cation transport ATPase
VRTFEEEQAELQRALDLLVMAASFTWMALVLMALMWLRRPLPPMRWLFPLLAVATVFGPGWHILRLAAASLRRGILNQHVLLELGALGGLLGGTLGLLAPAFPMADFFGVAVFITTYHILSGYASLLVRTRAPRQCAGYWPCSPPRRASSGKAEKKRCRSRRWWRATTSGSAPANPFPWTAW